MSKSLLILILFIFIKSYSQDPSTFRNPITHMEVKSPGISDFVKYGNLSSSSYTGELKVNLPIVNIPIKDNNPLNLGLSYVGSGFKPSKRDGLVGQNWYLNVGGVITREINGVSDMQKGHTQSIGGSPHYTNGFILGVLGQNLQGTSGQTHNPQDVFNFHPNVTYNSPYLEEYLFANTVSNTLDTKNYEGTPDVFSFTFNGISGKFFMGNDGQVKVSTNSPTVLSVDLSELNFENDVHNSCIPAVPSRISITDDKGNKYYFGGETKNLEYNINVLSEGHNNIENPIITSWFLYKVEYYNDKIIEFNYRDDSSLNNIQSGHFANEENIIHGSPNFPDYTGSTSASIKDFLQLSEYYNENRNLYSSQDFHGYGFVNGYSDHNLSIQLRKIAILEEIESDDFKISFKYSRQDHEFNRRDDMDDPFEEPINDSYFFEDFYDIYLSSITIAPKVNERIGFITKEFKFNYNNLGGQHNRLFLTSFGEKNKPFYKFEYYGLNDGGTNSASLPKPITKGVDHWGYWNGKNADSNQLIPRVIINSSGDMTYPSNSTSRDPNFDFSTIGQLSKMIYPTGGYSNFEYEPHNYSKRLEIRSADLFVPNLYNETGIAGGTRLSKITDYVNNQPTNEKEYFYSGGTLLFWPRYVLYYEYGSPVSINKLGYIRSNPIGKYLQESLVMTYSTVTEQTSSNGKIVTEYRDFVSNGDDYDYNWKYSNAVSPSTVFIPNGGDNISKNYYAYLLNDRSIERGKPSNMKIFDSENTLKEETIYTYNNDPNRFNMFSTQIHLTGLFVQANKMYYYSDFLTKEENIKYLNNGSFTTITENEYDPILKKIRTSTVLSSENHPLLKEYDYSFISNDHLVLLDQSRVLKNGQLLSKQTITYGDNSDSETNYKYYPKELKEFKFQAQNISESKQIFISKYDDKGNPLEVYKSDENSTLYTVYLWGYGKTKLIAKIENADYNLVSQSVNIINLQNISNADNDSSLSSENNLRAALSNLRNTPELSNSFITTYTYDLLKGVSSITDPRGNTINYSYDNVGRLKFIKDKDGNKLNKFQYNYQSQN